MVENERMQQATQEKLKSMWESIFVPYLRVCKPLFC